MSFLTTSLVLCGDDDDDDEELMSRLIDLLDERGVTCWFVSLAAAIAVFRSRKRPCSDATPSYPDWIWLINHSQGSHAPHRALLEVFIFSCVEDLIQSKSQLTCSQPLNLVVASSSGRITNKMSNYKFKFGLLDSGPVGIYPAGGEIKQLTFSV